MGRKTKDKKKKRRENSPDDTKSTSVNKKLQGVLYQKGKIYTKNLVPGKKVYDESLVKISGVEYRTWSPEKSKLGAAIIKGVSQIGIRPGSTVLYLGASTGTTISHVSDIIGKEGFVFGVEFAPRVARELVFLAEERPNIAPILGDANKPMEYSDRCFLVDVVFQDIAQKNQVEIFMKNVDLFLKKGGFGLLAIKARSIDVSKKPKAVFKEVRTLLDKRITIVDYKELAPYEKDHCFFVVKK
jgi:fibrillarin-like pre-rRNA processing protein